MTWRGFRRHMAGMLALLAATSCSAAGEPPLAEAPAPEPCAPTPAGGVLEPPSVREILIPPSAPPELRGRDVQVHLRIDEAGRVDPSAVRVEGSADEAYNRRLARSLGRYRFHPARRDGCPVAAELSIRLTL